MFREYQTLSFNRASVCANHAAYEDFVCTASSLDAEFDAGACDMLAALNGKIGLDCASKLQNLSIKS